MKIISRISIFLLRELTPFLILQLKNSGLTDLQITSGRMNTFQQKKGVRNFFSSEPDLGSDALDVITILVDPTIEDSVLYFIVQTMKLKIQGRGSIFSERVRMIKGHSLCRVNSTFMKKAESTGIFSGLMGITCIVQRDEGDRLAQVILNTGTCVPALYYGLGTGLRDKLGLLRITIPAEKEILQLVARQEEADEVMELMIEQGNLDQPGKGFIYLYQIEKGLINTRTHRDPPPHIATLEQVVAELDHLKGNLRWRLHNVEGSSEVSEPRYYLKQLVEFRLTCNEGYGAELVKEAMSAGVAGATIFKTKHHFADSSSQMQISPAREVCNMIISENLLENVIRILEIKRAFEDEIAAIVEARSVDKACTYLVNKK